MRRNKGFTLAEVLMVIAILAILFALSVPAVSNIQKNLKQRELDAKAETIYTAVQNRLSELYSSGSSYKYNPKTYSSNSNIEDKIIKLNKEPGDLDDDSWNSGYDHVYYFVSGGEVASEILGSENLSKELLNGNFVVEIIPYTKSDDLEKQITAGTVYAVWYSEGDLNVSDDYPSNNDYNIMYRVKNNRRELIKGDTGLGYYGGSSGTGTNTNTLSISKIEITSNEEINKANIVVNKPINITDKVVVTFTFTDAYGKKVEIGFDTSSTRFTYNGAGMPDRTKSYFTYVKSGINYIFSFTLDDLSAQGSRFGSIFGTDLTVGSNIKLEVNAKAVTNSGTQNWLVASANAETYGNSIYAYVYKDKLEDGFKQNEEICISNGRHLQNLDEGSNVENKFTKAKLLNDISFKEDGDFYNTYNKKYFNSKTTITKINSNSTTSSLSVPNFKSITNKNLKILDGSSEDGNYKIYNLSSLNTNGGLFGNVENELTIKNISLVGAKISGTNVGGLVGNNSGNLIINNCELYLDTVNDDIPTIISSDKTIENIKWIQGTTAGGLVGTNVGTANIVNSLASSVLSGQTTGGLVGSNNGTLNISKTYADSYLYGNNVGGLVGNANGETNLASCYASGYIILNENGTGAGLVNGTITSVKNAYTVTSVYNAYEGGIGSSFLSGEYYATAKNVKSGVTSLYFSSIGNIDTVYGNEGVNKNIFSNDENFTSSSVLKSVPYKMLGQSLSSYPYPRILGQEHYGDWDSNFTAGALVYFEKYNDDTYGFDGADIKSSLLSDKTIVGDGYGIVFKEGEIGDYFEVNNKKYEITTTTTYYSVTVSGVKYRIYPLDKDDNNPTSIDSYFLRTRIYSHFSDETSFEKYYDYNPHFASTVVEVNGQDAGKTVNPSVVSIRTARQFYNLSSYYDSYHDLLESSIVYRQGKEIDYTTYDWNSFTNFGNSITEQKPIGSENKKFIGTYDGNYFEINNISFVIESSEGLGMFGYNNGTIKNIFLATSNSNTYYIKKNTTTGSNQKLYAGVLVGYNNGTIDNCAVTGYSLADDYTLNGDLNSNLYVGGLVGYNDSNGKISNSSLDILEIDTNVYRGTAYVGGFVGYNLGRITNSYDLTYLYTYAQNSNVSTAGFAGFNTGYIANSYCATALIVSGSNVYGFAPNSSGTVVSSYYLGVGTYDFNGELYSYNISSNNSSGTSRTYKELSNITQKANISKYHANTNETNYPYKAYVKNSNDNYVHYGNWQTSAVLGAYGIFYWEYEEGENEGYHISFIGLDNSIPIYNSTLCKEHDDGGVITSFGYGYYHSSDINVSVDSYNGIAFSEGKENTIANTKLNAQFSSLTFHSFTTTTDTSNDYIYLITNDINGNITLKSEEDSHTFYLSPFFGDAIALYMDETTLNNLQDANKNIAFTSDLLAHISTTTTYGRDILSSDLKTPGTNSNKYEIRSIVQLQYLNWNYNSKSYSNLVTSDTSNYRNYNYLMSTYISGRGTQTADAAVNANNQYLYFEISHDVNAKRNNGSYLINNFTPIAGQKTHSSGSYNAVLYTWFGSHFHGESYKIQELHINSSSYSVGMFGVTAGAEIKDVILYSKNKAVIKRSTTNNDGDNPNYFNDDGGYSIGGLIGVAYGYSGLTGNSSNTIKNCAISGYQIIDESSNKQTHGEANIGGLIGVSNVNIEQCSAVVDIKINCKHNNNGTFTYGPWGNFIRVGGLAGAVQYKITNSYTGGTISVDSDVLQETYSGSNSNYYNSRISTSSTSTATVRYSTHVYIAGIAGSGFTMNYQNFTNNASLTDGVPDVENCYTYMSFPAYEGTIRSIAMITSMADRYSTSNTGSGKNPTIKNCFYLESSADIDVSNAPRYRFGNNYTSAYDLFNNSSTDYLTSMINGNVNLAGKLISNMNSGVNNPNISVELPISYSELIGETNISSVDKSLLSLLNEFNQNNGYNITWAEVSKEEGNSGKYSFPSGDKSLEGRDYPFPSVIRQDNYYVHYGIWSFPSAYFEEVLVSMNIFDYLNKTTNLSTYTISLNVNGRNIYDLNFETEDGDVLRIDTNSIETEYVTNADGSFIYDEYGQKLVKRYTVKVDALKTSTGKIKATWKDVNEQNYTDTQIFNITAEYEININPESLKVGNGEQGLFTISACSLGKTSDNGITCEEGYDLTNNVVWEPTSSLIGNTEYPTLSGLKQVDNQISFTGTGYNGILTLKGTYTYNGEEYLAYGSAIVERKSGLGFGYTIEDITSYKESTIYTQEDIDEDKVSPEISIKGEGITYYEGIAPINENQFYLYQYDNELLNKAYTECQAATSCNIKVELLEDLGYVNEEDYSYSLKEVSEADENKFSYLGIEIIYRPKNYDENKKIRIGITLIDSNTNLTYSFISDYMKLEFTPYDLTLESNYDGGESRTIKATKDLILSNYNPERVGYTFAGWYTEATCENKFIYNYTNITSDLTIYAKWEPITKEITLTNDIDTQIVIATYNDDTPFEIEDALKTNEENGKLKYFLDDEGNIVINKDGSFDLKTMNNFILSDKNALTGEYVLSRKVNLYTKAKDSSNVEILATDVDNETTSISVDTSGYIGNKYIKFEIEGWYLEDGTQVLDKDGNVISNINTITADGHFDTDNRDEINLFAHWVRSESIDAYIKADLFEADHKYIISNVSYGDGYMVFASPTKNDTLSKIEITINKSSDERYYIQTDSSYEWTITNGNSGRFRMNSNGKYLGVYWDNTKVNSNLTSESSKNFIYDSEYLYTETNNSRNNVYYLRWTGDSFNMNNKYYTKMYIYKYTPKDSEDSIKISEITEYFEYLTDDEEIIEDTNEENPTQDEEIQDEDIQDEKVDEVETDETIQDETTTKNTTDETVDEDVLTDENTKENIDETKTEDIQETVEETTSEKTDNISQVEDVNSLEAELITNSLIESEVKNEEENEEQIAE